MEEFLEHLVGHVVVDVGEVAPVLGQLQQGQEEGRLVDMGLWGGRQELLSLGSSPWQFFEWCVES